VAKADRGTGYLFRPTYRDRHGERKQTETWYWRVSEGGKKRTVSTGHTDPKKARAWVRERLVEMGRGDRSGLVADTVTLARLERLVLDDYILKGRDERKRRHVPLSFGRLRGFLGNARAKDVTEARLREYAAVRLAHGAAPATVNLDFNILGRGFSLAARMGLVPARPRGWIPRLKVRNARKGFLDRATFDAILRHVPEVLHGALTAAYITGWRLASDLLTRQWRHVDLAAGWLRLEPGEGKTAEPRMFPLTPELREVLERQRAYTDTVERERRRVVPWVFHRNGKPIRSLQKAWEAARAAAGFPGALIHDFRRTAARDGIRAGNSQAEVMAMMGLETPSIFKRYAVIDEVMLKEAAARLAALHEAQRAEASKVAAMPAAGKRRRRPSSG
jgi:integrase